MQARAAPGGRHPEHPVERDGAGEAARRGRLQRLHAAEAEAEDRDALGAELVGGDRQVGELHVVVELGQVGEARVGMGGVAHDGGGAGERVRAAHRVAVGGDAAAQVVEERADAHEVGVHDERAGRVAVVGPCRDGWDRRAVAALEDDAGSERRVGPRFQGRHQA